MTSPTCDSMDDELMREARRETTTTARDTARFNIQHFTRARSKFRSRGGKRRRNEIINFPNMNNVDVRLRVAIPHVSQTRLTSQYERSDCLCMLCVVIHSTLTLGVQWSRFHSSLKYLDFTSTALFKSLESNWILTSIPRQVVTLLRKPT